jgi:hypothetical protein
MDVGGEGLGVLLRCTGIPATMVRLGVLCNQEAPQQQRKQPEKYDPAKQGPQ